MTEESKGSAEKMEVEVGRWTPDGTFTGETLRFTAEEVGSYTDRSLADSEDDRGSRTRSTGRSPAAKAGGGLRESARSWRRSTTSS